MKILDCTLRDGGYYTNWDFSHDLVTQYFKSFNNLPVDYLELGYRSKPLKEYLGEYFYCPVYLLENIRKLSSKKLAVMLNEKDVQTSDVKGLLAPCRDYLDMVRIAVDPQNLLRAVAVAEEVKKLGYEIAFNVMYMSKWKQQAGFLNELGSVDGIADYLYIVDSYGGVYPKDVIETIGLVREKTSCAIGFHGHNNLELALINSLTALEHGAEIVDATVTGMGRGAGNLRTELLLAALSSGDRPPIDFNSLSLIVDGFEKLKRQHEWGTNLPYMISGANSLPQKDVMEWVTQRFYSFNSIIRALQNQKAGVEDNEKFSFFKPSKKFSRAIIVGGGPSAVMHRDAIKQFISKSEDTCLIHASSKNADGYKDLPIEQYFCLVGSEGHRLENAFRDWSEFKGQCVLPPYPRKMGTYIPNELRNRSFELNKVTFTDKILDSHTVLALQSALELGAKEIFLVGYDGYKEKTITQLEMALSEENESTFAAFIKNSGVKLLAITPTNYSIPVKSIYSLLQ